MREKRNEEPEWYSGLSTRYQDVFTSASHALEVGDWVELGRAMNSNHAILQELTVSCDELDSLVDVARNAGAVGAKMSGTGRGGLMMALTPGDQQDKVFAALEASGIAQQVWRTRLVPATGHPVR